MRSWAAALVLALAVLPGAARAQERHGGQGSGYMGILFGWEDDHARVQDVIEGSPADRAGVRRGDEVLRIDGHAATEDAVDDLREHLQRGDSVRLTLRRDGREEQRVVVAGDRPDRVVFERRSRGPVTIVRPGGGDVVIHMDSMGMAMDSLLRRMDSLRSRMRMHYGDSIVIHTDTVVRMFRDSLLRQLPRAEMEMRRAFPMVWEFGSRTIAGAEFAEMNPGLGRHFGTDHGLLVLQVARETPSARGGLQPGDVVVEADGRAVNGARELRDAFVRADGHEVRLTVLRDGHRQQVNVRWEAPETRVFRLDTERRERTRRP